LEARCVEIAGRLAAIIEHLVWPRTAHGAL
jgi:hypothetical protein